MAVINPVNTMSAHRITETCQIIIPIWFHMALEFFIRKCFVLCLFNRFNNFRIIGKHWMNMKVH
jgi:hypothetical protein